MTLFFRSKQTILNQLSALRDAIDDELGCKHPNYKKIQSWQTRYDKCVNELAQIEIHSWRKMRPLV